MLEPLLTAEVANIDESLGAAEVVFTEEYSSLENSNFPKNQSSLGSHDSHLSLDQLPSTKLKLTKVRFDGNTVVDDDILQNVAALFIGRELEFDDLYELRDRITRVYTDRGYLNSSAFLPDQEVKDGRIAYKVIEGALTEVNIEGQGRLSDAYITDRILGGASVPFNSIALQNNFRRLLSDPMIDDLDGELKALPELGTTALNIQVTRAKPYEFSVSGSNHGSPGLGEGQLSVGGTIRNLSGLGDQVKVSVNANENKYSLITEYEVPLNSQDTRIKLLLALANSGVVEEFVEAVDIESSYLGLEVSVTHPLKRGLDRAFIIGAGLSVRENNNTLLDLPYSFSAGEEEGRSKVSVVKFWQDLVNRKKSSVLAVRSVLNVGVEAFGATAHSNELPDSQFFSLQSQIQYAHRYFRDRGQVLLRLNSQLASGPLLSLEKMSVGGADTVRGYRQNELVRDQAVFASAELQYDIYRSADLGVFQVAPFIDLGYGRNRSSEPDQEQLASVGLGLLWKYKSRFSGELYFGSALTDAQDSEGDDLQDRGIHLKLAAQW